MPRVKRGIGYIEGAISLIDQNPKELSTTGTEIVNGQNGQMSSINFSNPNLIRFVTFNLFSK